jgi:MbtH protein
MQKRDMQKDDNEKQFTVVINHEDQYSVWPSGRALPLGWKATGFVGTKAACLAHIGEVWKDMTPRSVREASTQEYQSND